MQSLVGRPAIAPALLGLKPLQPRHKRVCAQPACFFCTEDLKRHQGLAVLPGRGAKPRAAVTVRLVPGEQAERALSSDDTEKEEQRPLMRTVFTSYDRWMVHRSSSRYFRHLTTIPGSRLVRGLLKPLLYVMGVSTLVCFYTQALQRGDLPAIFPDLQIKSKELFGLTSFALSLLLVFRTNASYERWDSARKMWGLVLNRSRDLVRQSLTWVPDDKGYLRDVFCRWVPAYSKALLCHLRYGADISKELEGLLLPHEISEVVKATHRPNYVLQVLSQAIKAANLPNAPTQRMEENLSNFEDCLGGCERILRTPIPLYYTRHTSRFMMIWLTLLPFALWGSCGWGTIPLAALIAFLLLGIEEIGVSIEEPFSILPLDVISNTILTNTRELEAVNSPAAKNGAGSAASDNGALPASARDILNEAMLASTNGYSAALTPALA